MLVNETKPQNHYNYNSNNENTWNSFVTTNGITYEVTFINCTAFLGEYPEISNSVYEMSILTQDSAPPLDLLVESTIIEITENFLHNNPIALLIICDSLDRKHEARKRKFSSWVNKSKLANDYEVHEGTTSISEVQIHNTVIFKSDLPIKKKILDALFEINEN